MRGGRLYTWHAVTRRYTPLHAVTRHRTRHLGDGNAGPLRDDCRDVLNANGGQASAAAAALKSGDLHEGPSLVHQIDGLVGQETVRDVTRRQPENAAAAGKG